MFKKNTAVTGFGIGHFIGVADGIAVTTGTPTCKRTLDGTGGACANTASYNTDGAVWEIDLAAGDMNGDVVVLSFALAGCIPISYTIKTVTKLVSDLVDAAAAPTAQDVWEYTTRTLTQSSTSTTDSTAAGSIARRRGDSWSISLTVGAITGYTSLWFSAKWDRDNTDAQSVLQIKLNASGLNDGLLYVNGAAATDDTLGSITVSDASTGAIVIAVDETITDDLPPAGVYYDVQVLNAGTVSTLDSGTLTITADVTRAVA